LPAKALMIIFSRVEMTKRKTYYYRWPVMLGMDALTIKQQKTTKKLRDR